MPWVAIKFPKQFICWTWAKTELALYYDEALMKLLTVWTVMITKLVYVP